MSVLRYRSNSNFRFEMSFKQQFPFWDVVQTAISVLIYMWSLFSAEDVVMQSATHAEDIVYIKKFHCKEFVRRFGISMPSSHAHQTALRGTIWPFFTDFAEENQMFSLFIISYTRQMNSTTRMQCDTTSRRQLFCKFILPADMGRAYAQ